MPNKDPDLKTEVARELKRGKDRQSDRIRQTILRALKRQKRSRYSLAEAIEAAGAAHSETIYRYLRGERDTTGDVIRAIMDELGLEIIDKGAPVRAPRKRTTKAAELAPV